MGHGTGESGLIFIPFSEWLPGPYSIQCEARREDVSGNNINRLFDRDITLKKPGIQQDIFKIEFRVE